MKLIAGLGNIGPQYDKTRHNTGFMVVDALADKHNLTFKRTKFEGMVADGMINGEKTLIVKPSTYMNDSGRCVQPLMDYYDIEPTDLTVVHDDMDLPIGAIRLKTHGSAGGHNGIKSIINALGNQYFNRVKVGIDHPDRSKVIDYVLGKFTTAQQKQFADGEIAAVSALEDWLAGETFDQLMNKYN
jgi:PTH1 family peptidyl-tRNA hydrolase